MIIFPDFCGIKKRVKDIKVISHDKAKSAHLLFSVNKLTIKRNLTIFAPK